MRVLIIGDPHGDLEKVKKISVKGVDLVILTGDLGRSNLMRKMAYEKIERQKKGLSKKEFSPIQEKKAFMEAYTSSMKVVKYLAKFAPVYTIYGNVESSNAKTKKKSKKIGIRLPFLTDNLKKVKGVRIINDKLVDFNGLRIGGLNYFISENWVQDFKPTDHKLLKKAKKETDKANQILKKFGNIDVLVCHQPPYGVLDKVTSKLVPKHWVGKYAGSKVILDYIKKRQPKYVFCGHIHEGEGMRKIGKTEVYNFGTLGHKIIEI